MCLGIPGQVREIYEQHGTRMGRLNFGGIVKEVCLAYLPEIAIGDYAIVHVGFAITQVDEASARETLQLFDEIGVLGDELDPAARSADASAPACPVDPWAGAGRGPREPSA